MKWRSSSLLLSYHWTCYCLPSHYLYHHHPVQYHQPSPSSFSIKQLPLGILWFAIAPVFVLCHISPISGTCLVDWSLAALFSVKDWFAFAKSNRLNRLLVAWGGWVLRGAFKQCNMLINTAACSRTTTKKTSCTHASIPPMSLHQEIHLLLSRASLYILNMSQKMFEW